jgi:hypothetical protein
MGSATWNTLPTSQTIVLHIADPTVCTSLYGSGASATCFVKPSAPPIPCSTGDANVAYNSVVSDVMACPPRDDEAFEATGTNEFGDAVGLAGTGSGATFKTITVTFRSWGCGDSGHWYSADCVTSNNQNFSSSGMDLTAHIYEVGPNSTVGAEIATSTPFGGTIPFRPSADGTNCTGSDAGKWFDAAANQCLNGYPVNLTFTFPTAVQAPSEVIWTVSFNTSGFGDTPFGYGTACASSGNPGCGYDSLNVGAWTYTNAPYSGTDLNADELFHSTGNPPNTLAVQSGQAGRTPLAKITIG